MGFLFLFFVGGFSGGGVCLVGFLGVIFGLSFLKLFKIRPIEGNLWLSKF